MSPDELRAQLWKLPTSERCAMLALSIIEDDPGSPAAELGLIRTAFEMGRRHTDHVRRMLAGNLRLNAARLERERVPRPVIEATGDARRVI